MVLGEPDELVHTITLRLDSANDIPWSLASDHHSLSLRFCTEALIERRECQCPADIAAVGVPACGCKGAFSNQGCWEAFCGTGRGSSSAGFDRLYSLTRQIFSGCTAVPGPQHNCYPSALFQTPVES